MAITDNRLSTADESIATETAVDRRPVVRVLTVDDEPAACKLLAIMLRPPAFSCSTANSGEEALLALQHERFDAVISDLQMPGIGGLELLARVLQPPILTSHSLSVTTGVDDVEVGVQAMRAGADDYLVKPLWESAVIASASRAPSTSGTSNSKSKTIASISKKWLRTAPYNSATLSSNSSEAMEDTLQALGAAIDLRDNDTAGHSQRVCRYAVGDCPRYGAGPKRNWEVSRKGAHLHAGHR